jgi:carbon storage regulator
MLVLTRKTEQAIVIDGRIRVRVLCVGGNRVRLGVEAPSDVPIRRNEVGTSLARHAELSGQSAASDLLLELCPRS